MDTSNSYGNKMSVEVEWRTKAIKGRHSKNSEAEMLHELPLVAVEMLKNSRYSGEQDSKPDAKNQNIGKNDRFINDYKKR